IIFWLAAPYKVKNRGSNRAAHRRQTGGHNQERISFIGRVVHLAGLAKVERRDSTASGVSSAPGRRHPSYWIRDRDAVTAARRLLPDAACSPAWPGALSFPETRWCPPRIARAPAAALQFPFAPA